MRPGQRRSLWPVPPVGPSVGADDPAAGADHAWAEGRHRHVIGPSVDRAHRAAVA
jgi:hypothetical protein